MSNETNRVSGVIKSVRPYTRRTDNVEMVLFNVAGSDNPIHLTVKQVISGAEVTSNFKALEGETLTVDFYAKGEKMLNDNECTKDMTIIKSFEFEASESAKMYSQAAARGMGLFTR